MHIPAYICAVAASTIVGHVLQRVTSPDVAYTYSCDPGQQYTDEATPYGKCGHREYSFLHSDRLQQLMLIGNVLQLQR